jgi:hypothetical protein
MQGIAKLMNILRGIAKSAVWKVDSAGSKTNKRKVQLNA